MAKICAVSVVTSLGLTWARSPLNCLPNRFYGTWLQIYIHILLKYIVQQIHIYFHMHCQNMSSAKFILWNSWIVSPEQSKTGGFLRQGRYQSVAMRLIASATVAMQCCSVAMRLHLRRLLLVMDECFLPVQQVSALSRVAHFWGRFQVIGIIVVSRKSDSYSAEELSQGLSQPVVSSFLSW